jgi:hypothetical protein
VRDEYSDGRGVDNAPLRVDRADVRQTDDDLTLILAVGVHVVLVRLRYDGCVDEVVNSAGSVAVWAVRAWTLIGRDLCLELDRRAATDLGFPRDFELRLDVNDESDTPVTIRLALDVPDLRLPREPPTAGVQTPHPYSHYSPGCTQTWSVPICWQRFGRRWSSAAAWSTSDSSGSAMLLAVGSSRCSMST